MTEWFGGKPAGWIHLIGNTYQAVVHRSRPSKCFSISEYGSLEAAKDAAEKWRYSLSTELNLTKNMIKRVENDGEKPFLLVKLQKDYVMKCDVEHLKFIEESIWTAWKGKDKKTYYVRRRDSVKKEQKYIMFHNLICPDYNQVDHINRDGLDNRTENLREGIECNPKNKGLQNNNTSGVAGVYLASDKNAFMAQINGDDKRLRKAFSINQYGAEKANQLAIEQRKKWEQEFGYYCF